MGDGFWPCPTCPADFLDEERFREHQLDCQPRGPLPKELTRREDPGADLERLVLDSAAALGREGFHVDRVPPDFRILSHHGAAKVTARLLATGRLDFVGHLGGRVVYFDAKSTGVPTRFDLRNLHPDQVATLRRRHEEGAVAFILIEFRKAPGRVRYFALTWPDLASFWGNVASIPFAHLRSSCHEVALVGRVLDLVGVTKALIGAREVGA